MFTPTDTRRAHALARSMRQAFPSYRAAYAAACRHVAGSKRAAAAPVPCPVRKLKAAVACYAAAGLVTAASWLACPAIAAAAAH